MKTKPATIDEYIATFPENVQEVLEQIRETVRKAAPKAEEAIKYDMPTYVLNGNLVFFGAYKKHIGFFGVPTEDPDFAKELSAYHTGNGSVQFPLDKPMPLKLITKIVKHRVKHTAEKAAAKKK